MKKTQVIILAISLIFPTVLSAAAFGPPEGRGPFGTGHLQMLQTVLDLTEDQSAAVKKLFAKSRENIQSVIRNNHLQRKDMKILRTLTGKFKEEGQKQLATVLSMEEMQTMREKVFADDALAFISLSSTEKRARSQNILGLDAEKAARVAAIVEQKKSQHEEVLLNLGFNPEQLLKFQHELITERKIIKESLQKIFSNEQMKLFEKINSNRMKMKGRGLFSGRTIQ